MPNGECSCPNGWTGYFCEIATNKFSLPSFNGKSYMIVPSQRYTHKDKRNGNEISSQYNNRRSLQVSLNFSTISVDGMLLWNDNKDMYLGLGLENGFLKVVSNLFGSKDKMFDLSSGGYLTDGAWHNINFDVDETGQISLMIDQKNVYNEVHNSAAEGNLDLLGDSFYLGKQDFFCTLIVKCKTNCQ
jgi:protein eyes shut